MTGKHTCRLTVELARASWWFDRLPPSLAWLKVAGYVFMGTMARPVAELADEIDHRSGEGLTLLVLAEKVDPRHF